MFRGMNFKKRLFCILLFLIALIILFLSWYSQDKDYSLRENELPETITSETLSSNAGLPLSAVQGCRMHTNDCFNIYRCGYNERDKISIYVYPFTKYYNERGIQVSPELSREFYELIKALKESEYYTSNREKACLIMPSLDLINQRRIDVQYSGKILNSLPSWSDVGGKNHIIFNMIPGQAPDFNTSLDVATERAILAGGGFSSLSYRPGFDVSVPVFNSQTRLILSRSTSLKPSYEKIFLLVSQLNYHVKYRLILEDIASTWRDNVLVLKQCPGNNNVMYSRCAGVGTFLYPHVMEFAQFCLVLRGARLGQTTLQDALMMGCIPVIVADTYVMPFSEVLDWSRAAVIIRDNQVADVVKILKTYSAIEILDMKKQLKFLWDNYFSSMKQIVLTTIRIINERVFPNSASSYEQWNSPQIPSLKESRSVLQPLFTVPLMSQKEKGFTAVVLTYDRVTLLFRVLKQVDLVPSLVKFVVIWNNVDKLPPSVSDWPKLTKPVQVIETKANKLSNRFFPYNEIETEAILSLDDDIFMLTADEIQFAFEIWSEFPDRLIGFPGRLHVSTNSTSHLKYESEWLNDVSLILTGAAFYHKYFSHLFTYAMPSAIRDWVDKHMNCEDIAMNFLVANYTKKAPIKVTPRKRFKCPECVNDDALGANQVHFIERSKCIEKFAELFGNLPLETVEFRVDPVLQQRGVPGSLKRFRNIGTI